MTNFDEWRELELRAVATINEFSAMGVRVPTGKGSPMTTAGILANQTARAFDAALDDDDGDQGFGEIPSRWEDVDAETRELVLWNVLRAPTVEDAALQSSLPLHVLKSWQIQPTFQRQLNELWARVGRARAADADEDTDLNWMRRSAAASTGGPC
jgi:hypothetical protein